MTRKNLLSAIVIAHREGELIKNALECLSVAAEKLKTLGVDCDFLVNIDKGNSKTARCVGRYIDRLNIRVFNTQFGDPGLSRNYIIGKARGEYVALIDADDMVTSDWLIEAVKRIRRETGDVLVHPEMELRFNSDGIISVDVRKDCSKDQWMNVLSLFADNRWCSVVVGKKEIFSRYRYSTSGNGWGYEDYYFNCVTMEGGVRHLVASGVTAFLLQKKESVTTKTWENHDVLPYVDLFDLRKMQYGVKKYGLPELPKQLRIIKMPDCVLDGIREIVRIMPEMEKIQSRRLDYVVSRNGTDEEYLIGAEFCNMIEGKIIRHASKTLAFVGNLVEMQEVRRRYGYKTLFALTEKVDNIVIDKNTIDYHGYFGWMYGIAKKLVLTRIVVQGRVHRLVINNDIVINEWVEEHQNFLKCNGIIVEKCFRARQNNMV